MAKTKKLPADIYILYGAFLYFSLYAQKNGFSKLPNSLVKIYKKLGFVTKMYQKHIEEITKKNFSVISSIDKRNGSDIDYILASITIIAEYYEQYSKAKKKRLFSPFSYSEILTLQDECIEINKNSPQIVDATFDFCEEYVKILREELM